MPAKNWVRWSFAVLVCQALAIFACASEKLETKKFADVIERAEAACKAQNCEPKQVLVAFDIDNTLLASPQPLGSDQWFTWQAGLLELDPSSKYLVASSIPDLVAKQGKMLVHHNMRLTHPSVPITIGRLAERGHPLLILTARGPETFDLTRASLEKVGIDLSSYALDAKKTGEMLPSQLAKIEDVFNEDEQTKFKLKSPKAVKYSNGIFLSAGQHKGAMLRLLLRSADADTGDDKKVKAVVFIDDLEKNTNAVFDAIAPTKKVDVTTLRFGGEDGNVQGFLSGDKSRVHRQWKHFRKTLDGAFN